MVRQTTSEQMSPEDFFALPRTSSAGSALLPAAAANYANDNTNKPRKGIHTSTDAGMVKQPTSEQSEFTMSSEDFPALPGTSGAGSALLPAGHAAPPAGHANHNADKPRKGIQTSTDGKLTNIPETMIPNQFGIVGLLSLVSAEKSDPSLVSLALGQDLSALGLTRNDTEECCPIFAAPWAGKPCKPQDIEYYVPPEYLLNGSVRRKLAPLQLTRHNDDLLFYLFYCFVGDSMQIAAAAELYNRNWRYHMEEKVWIYMPAAVPMGEKTYECGTYFFFDPNLWRKVQKEFRLDYIKLEGRPVPLSNSFTSFLNDT